MWLGILWIGIATMIAIGILLFFLRFTKVEEGTAKAVVRLGGFKKIMMTWEKHKLTEDWNVLEVEEGKEEKGYLPGGLRFVGFRLFDKVYEYKFRWRDLRLVEALEKPEFHELIIDYTLVKPDVYWTTIKAAETKPPERIPLDVQFLITIRVINPYKALFRAPPNWHENVITRLNALFRNWIGTKKLDKILKLHKGPQEAQKIWEELGSNPLIQMFKEDWGILIEENGIQIREITLPPEYQASAARERQMELEAKGKAAEIVGPVIEMMARSRGKSPKTIQEEIEKSPKKRKEFLRLVKELMIRDMGIKGGAYLDIRVEGAEGLERIILNALATWKKMPIKKTRKEQKPQTRVEEVKERIKKKKKW